MERTGLWPWQIYTFQSDTMHMYIAHSSVHPDTENLCQI